MNFLNMFEDRIGGLFGATAQGLTAPFSFKKLAKKAAREMEAETFVIDGVDTAPALYTILVSTDDDMAMRPLYAQLTNETSQFIEGQAQNKGYVFVGRPLVRFMADPSLKSGKFSVFAENVDARTLSRLREEEAKFMGADSGLDGGLGGAASRHSESHQARAAAAPASAAASAAPVIQGQLTPTPMEGSDAGLDVLPQETVLDAEEAAFAGARARQHVQNLPTMDPEPVAPSAPVMGANAAEFASAGQAAGAAYAASGAAAAAASAIPQVQPSFAPAPAPQQVPAAEPMPAPQPMPQAVPVPQTIRATTPVPAPAPQPTPQPATSQPVPVTCLLIDRQSGRTYTASAPRTIIGRERTPGGIVLHDPNVSRSHAELSHDGRSWRIRDLNSTNGTLVNDVDVDECALRDGDLITLGLVNLEFRES